MKGGSQPFRSRLLRNREGCRISTILSDRGGRGGERGRILRDSSAYLIKAFLARRIGALWKSRGSRILCHLSDPGNERCEPAMAVRGFGIKVSTKVLFHQRT